MKRLSIIPLFVALLVIVLPSQANAAQDCGFVSDPEDNVWRIASSNLPCEKAWNLGERYLAFQVNHNWHRKVIVDGFRCYAGASVAGYCSRGRRGIWVLTERQKEVNGLHVTRPRLYAAEA